MKPDCSQFNPDAFYLRELISKAGLSQRGAAKQIGVAERTMRDYLNPAKENSKAPYVVQFALECLAENRESL